MHTLVDADCIVWDAVDVLDTRTTAPTSIAMRRLVIYARRSNWQAKLCEEVDGVLVEIADIPGLKEGSAKIVPGTDMVSIYCTAREAYPGPFKLLRHDVDVAGVLPLDYIAVRRLRTVCQKFIKPFLPSSLWPAIEPYCK